MKKLLLLLVLAPALAVAQPDIFGAIQNNDIDLLKSFLAADPANATKPTRKGVTPLHWAARLDRQEAAWLLLKAGVPADIRVTDSRTTPLHWAASTNSVDVLRLLLKHKADANARSKGGFTPLHLAASKGAPACVSNLLDAKADPLAADDAGNTPLHLAAARGRADVVAILLRRGADPERANAKGVKPVDLAADPDMRALFGVPAAEAPAKAEPAPAPVQERSAAPSAAAVDAFGTPGKTSAERFALFASASGTIRLDDGTLYNGGWSHGRFEGAGIHVLNADGERYEGSFRNGRRHGRGRYVYSNGDVLECDWDDDIPDGVGSFAFATGGTVRGTWKNGVLREGSGTFSTTSGAQSFGIWNDGNLVSSQPVSR